jgi:hypothetical protein
MTERSSSASMRASKEVVPTVTKTDFDEEGEEGEEGNWSFCLPSVLLRDTDVLFILSSCFVCVRVLQVRASPPPPRSSSEELGESKSKRGATFWFGTKLSLKLFSLFCQNEETFRIASTP